MKNMHKFGYIFLICLVMMNIIHQLPASLAIDKENHLKVDDMEYNFSYIITSSNGEVYFYPIGMVSTEVGGKIRLDFTGFYDEWGTEQPFYNVSFYYSDGRLNSTVVNVSQSTIGMNLILGFGGFSPNILSDTDWDAQDILARSVANAPSSASWPGLNGTLNITSEYGRHVYEYQQNPANGTQETRLVYEESSGLLYEFSSKFEGYQLSASLLPVSHIEYTITSSNGEVYFYPIGMVSTEVGGKIRLDFTGFYDEWGTEQPFYNVSFYYSDGRLNSTVVNVSQSTIGMNLILGFGGFSPNILSDTDWDAQDILARSVANAPSSASWPGLNGTLNITSEYGRHVYEYQQNPANGTQETRLVYEESSGLLYEFSSKFEGYQLSASLLPVSHIEYTITSSNGEVYFYPIGMVSTEVGGKIRLDFTGFYDEWGTEQPFYNVSFYYSDGRLNSTVVNVSQSTIGMNLILGFGGFSPNILSDTDWDAQDILARSVANAPSSASWPGLNGTLNITSEYGRHVYEYQQNPANGTQETRLVYEESSGLLYEFSSKFANYSLDGILYFESQPPYLNSHLNLQIITTSDDNNTTDDTTSDDTTSDDTTSDNDDIDQEKPYGIPSYSTTGIFVIALFMIIMLKKQVNFKKD
ncbi:MAG: hypothetical protein K9W44_02660 [Candidatus Lokiarchaeota archaeon]|nr:hypothetical protein [Candidatus Harpocratesius repetitus]